MKKERTDKPQRSPEERRETDLESMKKGEATYESTNSKQANKWRDLPTVVK